MPSVTDLSATSTQKNTGLAGVPEILKRVRAIEMCPAGDTISSGFTTPAATMLAKTTNNSAASRSYMIGPMGEVTDGTTETVRLQFAFGYEISIAYGKPIMTLHPVTNDQRVIDQMQQFNGLNKTFGVRLFDEDYNLIGTAGTTEAALKAFSLEDIWTDGRRIDGFSENKPGIRLVFSNPKEFNDGNLRYWETGIDLADSAVLARMNGIKLSEITAADASRIVYLKAKVHSTNLATSLIASAFTQTGAWEGVNDTDGSIIACSAASIETVAGESVYKLTFDATNYPSSSDTFTIRTKTPSVLAGLATPIVGYETITTLNQTAA